MPTLPYKDMPAKGQTESPILTGAPSEQRYRRTPTKSPLITAPERTIRRTSTRRYRPRAVDELDKKLGVISDSLKKQYAMQNRVLLNQGLEEEEYNVKRAQLDNQFYGAMMGEKAKHDAMRGRLDHIDQERIRGRITREEAERAKWTLVDPDTERAIARMEAARPKPKQPKGYTLSQTEDIVDLAYELAESAETDRAFFLPKGKEKKTREGLMKSYSRYKELNNYDLVGDEQKQRLDTEWDNAMRSDPKFDAWWPDKGKRKVLAEIGASRPSGAIAGAMKERVPGTAKASPLTDAMRVEGLRRRRKYVTGQTGQTKTRIDDPFKLR